MPVFTLAHTTFWAKMTKRFYERGSMGRHSHKLWILMAFALAACTSPGGGPLGGDALTGALDSVGPGLGVQGADGGTWDDAANTPDRQGSKVDLDPGGHYKFLFLARTTMIGKQPNLYDPDKCQKLMDCTVYYLSCDDFLALSVTWGDNPNQCKIAEWEGIAYQPEKTELDCRHMLPCTALAPATPNTLEVEDENNDQPKQFLFCTKEYPEGKTIQEGNQCRLPSWPEDAWMECPTFHAYCEANTPKIVKKNKDSGDAEWFEFDTEQPVGQQPYDYEQKYPDIELP